MKRSPLVAAVLRLLCAIAISPIVPGIVLWIVATTVTGARAELFWIAAPVILGFPVLIVLGLPLCYLLLRRDWLRLWYFLAIGGALGCLAFFAPVLWAQALGGGHTEPASIGMIFDIFGSFLNDYSSFLPVFAVSGAVAAACFWAIARPSFPVWRRYVQRKALTNQLSEMELSNLIEVYRASARSHGEATEHGDHKTANGSANAIAAIYVEIENRGSDAADRLLALLTDPAPGVRLWSASHTLDRFPARAVPVLEQLTSSTRLIGMSAQTTLNEWRAGRLRFSRAKISDV